MTEPENLIGDDTHYVNESYRVRLADEMKHFWEQVHVDMNAVNIKTEQEFKTHNDLPLARIKRIMKSDEDVRMISAEAPVMFAKACEIFILELSLRSWCISERNKRKTLIREDVQDCVNETAEQDFLIDVICVDEPLGAGNEPPPAANKGFGKHKY